MVEIKNKILYEKVKKEITKAIKEKKNNKRVIKF
jgi:hypothetical protein